MEAEESREGLMHCWFYGFGENNQNEEALSNHHNEEGAEPYKEKLFIYQSVYFLTITCGQDVWVMTERMAWQMGTPGS